MYTWILVFLLCSWKIETLVLKLKDQKLQTIYAALSLETTNDVQSVDAFLWLRRA